MKVGCAAWVFTAPRYNPPYEDAIDAIGEIGYETLELILYRAEDLAEYWTPSRIDAIKRQIGSYGLEISEFALYQDAVSHIVSLDRQERERALDTFDKGAALAKSMGSPIVNMVGQWPIGMEAPIPYVPSYYHTVFRGGARYDPKLKIDLPSGFDWDALWETYVDSIKTCTQIARSHGLRFALEGHAHVMVPHTDSFLRLWDHVQDDALGFNYDTAWQFVQREYIPWSIHKLQDKLFHLHVRDADGLVSYGLPPGMGIIDWPSLIRALRDIGYDGALSLELGAYADPHYYAKWSLEFLQRMLAEA